MMDKPPKKEIVELNGSIINFTSRVCLKRTSHAFDAESLSGVVKNRLLNFNQDLGLALDTNA
jgi:hypothetical protein